jgi:ATP-dependent Clp protease ATP-binding subunit ClpX
LKDLISDRKNGSNIGFGADIKDKKAEGDLKEVTPDDLTKYGMIPEFIGRFTTTVSIGELNKEELLKVLTKVKNNYIEQYKYLLSIDNIKLTFSPSALDQIVENCLKLKTGARGLHTEIEKVLMPAMFNTKKYRENNITKIDISREQVLEPKSMI